MSNKSVRVQLDKNDNLTMVGAAWLVWRMRNGKPEFLGLYASQEAADDDVSVMQANKGWQATAVTMIGWGALVLQDMPLAPLGDDARAMRDGSRAV